MKIAFVVWQLVIEKYLFFFYELAFKLKYCWTPEGPVWEISRVYAGFYEQNTTYYQIRG